MIPFLVISSAVFFLLISYVLHRHNTKKAGPLPPGPKGLPLIGNMHEFDAMHPHLYLYELAKKYGPLLSLKFGSRPVIVFSSARVAKLALKTHDLVLSDRPKFISFLELSYNGLDIAFSPYDDNWREMRKLSVLHLFSPKQVVSYRPVRKEEVGYTIKDISDKAKSNEVINLSEAIFFLTNRIICRVAFGKKYDEAGRRRFDQLFKEAQQTAAIFFLGDYFPSLGWIDRLMGKISRLEKNCKVLDAFYEELIQNHLDPDRAESMNGDILDLLINVKREELGWDGINWDNIKGVIVDLFIAGTDTSATLIIWAMTLLIKMPEVMQRVQKEVREVIGTKGSVEEEDVQKMPYLKAILKETLRLFPPAVLSVAREAMEDCTIDGYHIPSKSLVYVSYYAVGRDPEYWDDPYEFKPERFMNSTIDYRGQDFGFIPFGSGRRGCPAINLAMATVELTLASLLYSFNWELPRGMTADGIDMDIFPGITNIKKVDLCLVAENHS